ncbi:MAG: VCBS repeat-containing protein [Pyrinomonadaceae bacterium]|nr:VCBS repeat-containing protein [Pyrinomonadaceae bacterium]
MRKIDLNGFELKPFSLLVFFGLLFYSLGVQAQTKSETNYIPLPPTSWEGNLEEISPKIPQPNSPQDFSIQRKVHVIYLVPTNKIYNDSYKVGMADTILHLRDFYQKELGSNYAFTLNDPIVEVYFTSHDTSWYQNNPNSSVDYKFWNNVVNDGKALTGATDNSADKWLFYIDADPLCGQVGGAAQVNGPFGVLPANDLRGLTGQQNIPPCPQDPPDNGNKYRWIGGLGHELGHTFGLPHPPGCGGSGTNYGCTGGQTAANSLMWVGYAFYPNTNLLPSDKTTCINSGFFTPQNLAPPKPFDFNGDNISDIGIWRPGNGFWYILNSSAGTFTYQNWGLNGDKLVPGDYDGDRKTDYAVWRSSDSTWYILRSATNTFSAVRFGIESDKPVPADYDGDNKTDIAIWRQSDGVWWVNRSATNIATAFRFGGNGDSPIPGDYNGDKRADFTVRRSTNNLWYVNNSYLNNFAGYSFGQTGDKLVSSDYDGDGKEDIAVWRPSNGIWYIRKSSDGSVIYISWGIGSDIPTPADYDGDGKTDAAVWRPGDNTFYILRSSSGSLPAYQLGSSGDIPVASAFVR